MVQHAQIHKCEEWKSHDYLTRKIFDKTQQHIMVKIPNKLSVVAMYFMETEVTPDRATDNIMFSVHS